MEFGNIESILTITFLVIGAFATAAAWIIARIPTRRQVDDMQDRLAGDIDNMRKSLHDRITKLQESFSEDIKDKTYLEGKFDLLIREVDGLKKND